MKVKAIREYGMIDVARVLCACMVVLIHMGFGNSIAIIPCVTRQAVPFFFLTSGFFLAKKLKGSGNALRTCWRYALSVLLVYAVWMIIWLPSIICDALAEHQNASLFYVICIVLRRILTAGIAPYWYLLVLAEGAMVLALIINRKWLGWVLCVCGLILNTLYCMNLEGAVGSMIHRVFYTVFSWENNVIMSGFPMLFIGALFSQNERTAGSLKLLAVALMYIGVIVAAFLLYPSDNALYGLPFGQTEAVLLFAFCIMLSRFSTGLSRDMCVFFRNISSVIFLTHTVILKIMGECLHVWDPLIRFAAAIACGILIMIAVRTVKWKPLMKVFMVKN